MTRRPVIAALLAVGLPFLSGAEGAAPTVRTFLALMSSLQKPLGAATPVSLVIDEPPPVVQPPVNPPVAPMPAPAPAPAPAAGDVDFREVTLPASNKVTGLELPADQKISSKKRYVLLKAVTDKPDQEVHWLVLGSVPNAQPSSLTAGNGKILQVFPNDQPDLIVVMAYSSLDGKPTETAVTKITVEVAAAGTPEQANPGGIRPLNSTLHVTVILDYAKSSPELLALRSSAALRNALKQADCVYHDVALTQVPEDMKALLAEAGGAPAVIVQDSAGAVLAKQHLSNADGVLKLVSELRSGK